MIEIKIPGTKLIVQLYSDNRFVVFDHNEAFIGSGTWIPVYKQVVMMTCFDNSDVPRQVTEQERKSIEDYLINSYDNLKLNS